MSPSHGKKRSIEDLHLSTTSISSCSTSYDYVISANSTKPKDILKRCFPEIVSNLDISPNSNTKIINHVASKSLLDDAAIEPFLHGKFDSQTERMSSFLWMIRKSNNSTNRELLNLLINLPSDLEKTSHNIRQVLRNEDHNLIVLKARKKVNVRRRVLGHKNTSTLSINSFSSESSFDSIHSVSTEATEDESKENYQKSKKRRTSSSNTHRQSSKPSTGTKNVNSQLPKEAIPVRASDQEIALDEGHLRSILSEDSIPEIIDDVTMGSTDEEFEVTLPLMSTDNQTSIEVRVEGKPLIIKDPMSMVGKSANTLLLIGDEDAIKALPGVQDVKILIQEEDECKHKKGNVSRAWNFIKQKAQTIWKSKKVKIVVLTTVASGIGVAAYVGIHWFNYVLNEGNKFDEFSDVTQEGWQDEGQFSTIRIPCVTAIPGINGNGEYIYTLIYKTLPCQTF